MSKFYVSDRGNLSPLFLFFNNQRYRLGVNHQMLPINKPKCPFFDNHNDGLMNFMEDGRNTEEVRLAVAPNFSVEKLGNKYVYKSTQLKNTTTYYGR